MKTILEIDFKIWVGIMILLAIAIGCYILGASCLKGALTLAWNTLKLVGSIIGSAINICRTRRQPERPSNNNPSRDTTEPPSLGRRFHLPMISIDNTTSAEPSNWHEMEEHEKLARGTVADIRRISANSRFTRNAL